MARQALIKSSSLCDLTPLLPTVFSHAYREGSAQTTHSLSRPEIRRDYPLNLSISLSGGKETNKDSPSNGE